MENKKEIKEIVLVCQECRETEIVNVFPSDWRCKYCESPVYTTHRLDDDDVIDKIASDAL